MIPDIAPVIADALAKARLVTISGDAGGGGAADSVTNNITSVIQTVLAAQLVSGSGMLQPDRDAPAGTAKENGRQSAVPPAAGSVPVGPGKTGLR
jgi:flotillin